MESDTQMPPMMPPEGNMMPEPENDDMLEPDSNVEGGEDVDSPKKKLQQKAGKISKEIAEYQGDDKVEVAKYVKGMVDKAADNVIDGDDDTDEPMDMDNMDDMGPDVATEQQMESVDHTEDIVNEIVNDLMYDRGARGTKRKEHNITNKAISQDSPFVSGR